MKKQLTLALLCALVTHAASADNGRTVLGTTVLGTAIGGAAGDGKGAGIGAGVGLASGLLFSGARSSRSNDPAYRANKINKYKNQQSINSDKMTQLEADSESLKQERANTTDSKQIRSLDKQIRSKDKQLNKLQRRNNKLQNKINKISY